MVERGSGDRVDAPLEHLCRKVEAVDVDDVSVGLTCSVLKSQLGHSSVVPCLNPATWILIFSLGGQL